MLNRSDAEQGNLMPGQPSLYQVNCLELEQHFFNTECVFVIPARLLLAIISDLLFSGTPSLAVIRLKRCTPIVHQTLVPII